MAHLLRTLTKTFPTTVTATKIHHHLRRLSTTKFSFDEDNFELPPISFEGMPTGREKSRNEFMTRGPPYAFDSWNEPDGSTIYRFDVPGVANDGVKIFSQGSTVYREGRARKDPTEETGRLFRALLEFPELEKDLVSARAEINNGVLFLKLRRVSVIN